MKTAICAIIKDEHLYLQEWIEWHLDLGFDAIHLFEDKGSKSHQEITDKYENVYLRRYEDDSELQKVLVKQNTSLRQLDLYRWFAKNYFKKFDFCAFIDIDEYIFLDKEYTLHSFLTEFKDVSATILGWKMMGANGLIEHSKNGIVKSYTKECDFIPSEEWNYKSIVNCHLYKGFATQHFASGAVDTNKKTIKDIHIKSLVYDKAHIKHYFTKSWEDWIFRIYERGDLENMHRKTDDFFECNKDMLSLKDKLKREIRYMVPKNSDLGNIDAINALSGYNGLYLKPYEGQRIGNILFMYQYAKRLSHDIKISDNTSYVKSKEFSDFVDFLELDITTEHGCPIEYHHITNKNITEFIQPKYITKYDIMTLSGWFQANINFNEAKNIKSRIRKKVKPNDYVVVNVRRGDFVYSKQHLVFGKDFYIKAMSMFGTEEKFLFVSDDIVWCRRNFNGENIFFHEHVSALDDFKILLGAKSVIFGNSTFSYWAALLNINDDKLIVCGKKWYTKEFEQLNEHLKKDFFPHNWLLI